MNNFLKTSMVNQYERDGFIFPLKCMTESKAREYRKRLEKHEREINSPLLAANRHQTHLLFTWADELIRNKKILDAVEEIIGPNILCWVTNFFIKEPKTEDFVSWHQDATYWGLEPPDKIITAWVALSDVPIESGAMKFLSGSHKIGQATHEDTFHKNNLLSRGQEIKIDVNEDEATDVILKAGEFSLHHVLLAHGSHPNSSSDRRIGFAIRYIPTSVRQTKLRDAAVLVRGKDEYNNFDLLSSPIRDLDENALKMHADSAARLQAAVYSGTDKKDFRP